MGFDVSAFCGVVTSGECTHRHLTERPDAWWQGLGRRCLHFTWGQRGAISLEGLGLEVTTDPQQAEFVLAHGTEALGRSTDGSAAEPCSLDSMRTLLEQCAPRRLPLVVANPDVVTVAGSELRWEERALIVRLVCSGDCLAPHIALPWQDQQLNMRAVEAQCARICVLSCARFFQAHARHAGAALQLAGRGGGADGEAGASHLS